MITTPRTVSLALLLLASIPAPPPLWAGLPQGPGRQADLERARLDTVVELVSRARGEQVDDVPALGAEALELLARSPDPKRELQLRLDLSWDASTHGDTGVGIAHAEQAHALATQLDDASGLARAEYHEALGHWYGCEPDQAIALLQRALERQRELDEDAAVATSLTLLGAIHRSRSAYDESLACHLEALDLAEDASAAARSQNNIALIYWALDENERARGYLELAVQAYRKLDNDMARAQALGNLGLILIELGEPAEALPVLAEALELQERFGNARSRAKLLSNLAFAHDRLGDADRALETYQQALELREQLGDEWGLARTLGAIAGMAEERGDFEQALGLYERAAAAAKRADARDELSHILGRQAHVHEALGAHREALRALQDQVALVAELDRAETLRRISELEGRTTLAAQEVLLLRERLVRNRALGAALATLAVGALGWVFFLVRRRAHLKLQAVHARLAEHTVELEEARGEIRELKQLLPICSYCKSVRDDVGRWQPVEDYLYDRGGRLTHGICPECLSGVQSHP
ncbi:MAG: tetratricopeptide repeat protein [Planctomycetota bacterium]